MVTFYFTAGSRFKKGSCDLHIRLSLNNLLILDAVRLYAEFLFVSVTTFQSHDLFSPLNHNRSLVLTHSDWLKGPFLIKQVHLFFGHCLKQA